jgi:hypothetical protein
MNPKILLVSIAIVILAACGSSNKFQATHAEDRALFSAINAINKKPNNEKALGDLKILYTKSVERHEEAVDVYKNSNDEAKWDKILTELNALQHIYNSLQATPGSFGIVKPKNYLRDIEEVKNAAAEDYYSRAQTLIEQGGRENSLLAWDYFKRANSYVNGYKDVARQIRDAYERSIVNVVINPIQEDNIFFPTNSWDGVPDLRYRPQEYQDQLVRELGGRTASYTAARFFNERDVRREKIQVDQEVSMRWRNIRPLSSAPRQYTRQASNSVEIGKDTTGKPVYKTVYATVYITENNFAVEGDLEYRVTDLNTRATIDNGVLHDQVSWLDNSATYSGDSRALSAQDWQMINNRTGFNQPTKADVMNTLMKKIYPDLKRRIQNAIR